MSELTQYFDEKVKEAKEVFPHWWDEEIDHLEEANKVAQEIYEQEITALNN